ncbi:hypothetical protein HRbin33_01652 [bacterium HR33]|nr:hypothetical protein HRbin33_01652 [bacterium HR33]
MVTRFLLARLDAEERRLGVSLDYLRHILRASPAAFLKFAMLFPLSKHRRSLPPAAYHVARILAAQHEDCGTCLQVEINLAREAGVSREVVQAALHGSTASMSPEIEDVYYFVRDVLEGGSDERGFRMRVRERYGEEGLVELAIAIAIARMFPTTKRALGYATKCALVQIEL